MIGGARGPSRRSPEKLTPIMFRQKQRSDIAIGWERASMAPIYHDEDNHPAMR